MQIITEGYKKGLQRKKGINPGGVDKNIELALALSEAQV